MYNWKNRKFQICLWGMLISLVILSVVFYATDGLLGDKEFSEYTRADWSIAILPLSVMLVSAIATLVFAIIIIITMIPIICMYPAIVDYVIKNKRFSEMDSETEFLVFDHNGFKRACCRKEGQNGLWISVKEYNLKTKSWVVLEEGRYIENADNLIYILRKDYKYDRVRICDIQGRPLSFY